MPNRSSVYIVRARSLAPTTSHYTPSDIVQSDSSGLALQWKHVLKRQIGPIQAICWRFPRATRRMQAPFMLWQFRLSYSEAAERFEILVLRHTLYNIVSYDGFDVGPFTHKSTIIIVILIQNSGLGGFNGLLVLLYSVRQIDDTEHTTRLRSQQSTVINPLAEREDNYDNFTDCRHKDLKFTTCSNETQRRAVSLRQLNFSFSTQRPYLSFSSVFLL